MKKTRQYTCTRRVNKEGRKIWVVLENDKKFYRIFKTQSLAIAYFKPLKTAAQMMVQQADGNKFTKVVYTIEEMSKRGVKTASKTIEHQVVEDSDKFFDEKEVRTKTTLLEPELKVKPKPKPKPKPLPEPEVVQPVIVEPVVQQVITPEPVIVEPVIVEPVIITPEPVVTQAPIIKEVYIDNIVKIDSNTGEIISDEELNRLMKTVENNKKVATSLTSINLFSELHELDQARIDEFEKQDMLNTSIIDEILNRKAVAQSSWQEETTTDENFNFENTDTIENTIYIKDKIQKPIIVNSQKIAFSDDPSTNKTSTIENIIDTKTEDSNIKSVDYGRIKEYTDYEKTQIQNFQKESLKKEDFSAKSATPVKEVSTKSSSAKFWSLTILLSILLMASLAAIVLWFVPIEALIK